MEKTRFPIQGDGDRSEHRTDLAITRGQFKNTAYFGLVFVDGCHAYDFVHQDTANALRYLRPGGLIVWHDYGMLKDVSRVVDEIARQMKVSALQG